MPGSDPRRLAEREAEIRGFHETYGKILRSYFMRRVHNHAEADDLTQDVLLQVMRQIDRGAVENPGAFVFTVAANLLKNRARRLKHLTANADAYAHSADTVEELSPERVLGDRQTLRALLDSLEDLAKTNARAAEIFVLHRIEGMKHAEIAQIYGIATSTVEKDIMRAMAHLARRAFLART